MTSLFSGRKFFKIKDEHGLPLDFALAQIIDAGQAVDWPEFIEYARECKWWDFQIITAMEYFLVDAGGKEYADEVLKRTKLYMLANVHPAMKFN